MAAGAADLAIGTAAALTAAVHVHRVLVHVPVHVRAADELAAVLRTFIAQT